MHWSVRKSGQLMSTVPDGGSVTSDALPVSRRYFTSRPTMPFEYTMKRKFLLCAIDWIESFASATTVSAVFQSGCATLVRTTLYFGAPVCVTAYTWSLWNTMPRTRLSDGDASTAHSSFALDFICAVGA